MMRRYSTRRPKAPFVRAAHVDPAMWRVNAVRRRWVLVEIERLERAGRWEWWIGAAAEQSIGGRTASGLAVPASQ